MEKVSDESWAERRRRSPCWSPLGREKKGEVVWWRARGRKANARKKEDALRSRRTWVRTSLQISRRTVAQTSLEALASHVTSSHEDGKRIAVVVPRKQARSRHVQAGLSTGTVVCSTVQLPQLASLDKGSRREGGMEDDARLAGQHDVAPVVSDASGRSGSGLPGSQPHMLLAS
nr:unnamed protein product [Digitaria exilis]